MDENNICINCKYDNCNYKECKISIGRPMYEKYDDKDNEIYMIVDKNFGCNKFRRKTNDTIDQRN